MYYSPLLYPQGECDPGFGSDFVFSVHAKELVVGEIFVRVYNEQPSFPLEVSIIQWDKPKINNLRYTPAILMGKCKLAFA